MRRLATIMAVLGFLATAVWAGADLVLVDGTLLRGRSVERKGNTYFLTTNRDNVIAVPVELVKEMRLTGGDAKPPTGLVYAGPMTLAGPELTLPGRRESLAAFGRPPALFQGSPMSFRWYPTNAYQGKDATQFNPVVWAQTTIDPIWSPLPAYTPSSDVTQFHPVLWRQPLIDPIWRPRDGFAPGEWLAPVVKEKE
ncbi:MAG: hypothetical protein LAO51_05380 [Acidobacteriia bacterium]|nr:hypothetical protein [Terriglobia bacterium]